MATTIMSALLERRVRMEVVIAHAPCPLVARLVKWDASVTGEENSAFRGLIPNKSRCRQPNAGDEALLREFVERYFPAGAGLTASLTGCLFAKG